MEFLKIVDWDAMAIILAFPNPNKEWFVYARTHYLDGNIYNDIGPAN
jgi:hypothetical protein